MASALFLLSLLCPAFSADILAVFPHSGVSHFDVFNPLSVALAKRGHSLTVLSFFPQKTPVPNLTDISLIGVTPFLVEKITFNITESGPIDNFFWVGGLGLETCKDIIYSKQAQDLLKSRRKFDLLIVEMFNTDCFFSFSKVFSTPFVAISSSNILPHHNIRLGNPDSLAFSSNVFYPMSRHMDLGERLVNSVTSLIMQVAWPLMFSRKEQQIVDNVLGETVLLTDIVQDASLLLVNSHHSIQGPRQMVPGIVEVGGLHIGAGKPINKVKK